MITNERSSPFGLRPTTPYRQPVEENTIKSVQTQVERKTITLTLKENQLGRFLRITEEAGGRRNSVMVPAAGLPELHKLLGEMIDASQQTPPMSSEGA